jgi:crotonobetainyl-CoA:carnitine CoA-transferase CaiB-like acyl-CoA transferase
MKPLEGLNILDFSHRLPGPLAGKILADLGALVTKIEDEKFKDPFLFGLFADLDESFPAWYEDLNRKKRILRLDFSQESTASLVHQLIEKTDGIIMGPPPKVRANLKIETKDLQKFKNSFGVVDLAASSSQKNMHDLNSLALTGFLSLHVEGRHEDVVDPPFLPVSGFLFGLKTALDLMAAIFKAKQSNEKVFHTSYLMESTEEILRPFYPQKILKKGMKKFLHNGRYPCYSIYRTKDGKHVALAAVEEKFWSKFTELFSLDLRPKDRFRPDPLVFKVISLRFLSLTQEEVFRILGEEDVCLSRV